MKCPKCGYSAPENPTECPSCGLIFEKWKKRQEPAPPPKEAVLPAPTTGESPAPPKASDPFFPGWEAVRKPRTPDEVFLKAALIFFGLGLVVFIVGLLIHMTSSVSP